MLFIDWIWYFSRRVHAQGQSWRLKVSKQTMFWSIRNQLKGISLFLATRTLSWMDRPKFEVILFPFFLWCATPAGSLLISPVCDVAADKGNNLIPTGEDDLLPKKRTCLNDNNSEKASRNIELVHIIDNQQKNNMQREMDTMRTTSTGNDEKGSIPAHQLELSLRRTDYGKLENQDKNDRRTLNHSTSSAFSL